LHMAAGRLQHLVGGLGEQAQVGGVVDQAGAAQQQVVVVAGEALEEPQQLGVVLARVVVLGEFLRAQALDVPGVEVFVADEAQQLGVAFARLQLLVALAHARQVAPAADEGGGVAVLQPAVAVVHHVEQEHVAGERRAAFAVPEGDGLLADAPHVAHQALAVERGRRARDHQPVRHAARGEADAPERAHFHGAVHQLVIAVRAVGAEARARGVVRGQARGQRPAGHGARAHHFQVVRLVFLAVHAQAQAGAVEEAARGVQPRGAHGGVVGGHLVLQHQWLAGAAARAPAVLVQLLQRHLGAALAGAQRLQVLGELAHQVAAGDPHGQRQLLPGGGPGHREGDSVEVGVLLRGVDAVVDGRHGGIDSGAACACCARISMGFLSETQCVKAQPAPE
jgi:hypothetical protein